MPDWLVVCVEMTGLTLCVAGVVDYLFAVVVDAILHM